MLSLYVKVFLGASLECPKLSSVHLLSGDFFRIFFLNLTTLSLYVKVFFGASLESQKLVIPRLMISVEGPRLVKIIFCSGLGGLSQILECILEAWKRRVIGF